MREQDGWDEHAAWANAQAANGFVVLGGPLDGGTSRFLLAIEAESEEHVRERLDEDPWTPAGLLRLASLQPWEILLR